MEKEGETMIWNNSKKQECTEVSMRTLFPSRPRWRETRGWHGGGEGYWRKVSLEEQDSFLPHPHPPLDPPMWRVEPTSAPFRQPGSKGKWLLGWAMPNESRDSGDYYCLPCRPRGRSVARIPGWTLPFVSVHHGSAAQTPESTRKSKGDDVFGLSALHLVHNFEVFF